MRIIQILLAIIAAILIFHWWPTIGIVLVVAAIAVWVWFLWKTRKARLKAEKDVRLAREVEPLYQEFLAKRKALRDKHDPEHKWSQFSWNQPGMPKDYSDEVAALAEAYKGVLVLKFGPSIIDPA